MKDITYCTNKKCKKKDCKRRISKMPKHDGCYRSIADFVGGENCKYYWSERED